MIFFVMMIIFKSSFDVFLPSYSKLKPNLSKIHQNKSQVHLLILLLIILEQSNSRKDPIENQRSYQSQREALWLNLHQLEKPIHN